MKENSQQVQTPILLNAGGLVILIGVFALGASIQELASPVVNPSMLSIYNSVAMLSFPVIGAGFFMVMFGLVIRTLREIKLST